MNSLLFAFRNIKRHQKRSVITIFTICLGFTALGVINGMLNNIFSRLKEQSIVTEKLGHISFAKEGFFENGKINPEQYLWTEQELVNIIKLLEDDTDVITASPRLQLFGMVSNGTASSIFTSEAVVPKDDKALQELPIDGRIEKVGRVTLSDAATAQANVAIGSELAANLGVKKGDYLTLLTSTKEGMANAVDVDIQEVYNTGNPATNDKFVLMNFSLAQELYDTKGAERIIVTSNKPKAIPALMARLSDKLKAAGHPVSAKSWDQVSPAYSKVKQMFGVIFRVLTIIITIIVLLTTLNTMQMAVNERSREIGTLRAIGMLKGNIVKLFCYEGLLMGFLGCLMAVPILLGLSAFFKFLNVTFIPPVASTPVPVNLLLYGSSFAPLFILFGIASLLSAFLAIRLVVQKELIISLRTIN